MTAVEDLPYFGFTSTTDDYLKVFQDDRVLVFIREILAGSVTYDATDVSMGAITVNGRSYFAIANNGTPFISAKLNMFGTGRNFARNAESTNREGMRYAMFNLCTHLSRGSSRGAGLILSKDPSNKLKINGKGLVPLEETPQGLSFTLANTRRQWNFVASSVKSLDEKFPLPKAIWRDDLCDIVSQIDKSNIKDWNVAFILEMDVEKLSSALPCPWGPYQLGVLEFCRATYPRPSETVPFCGSTRVSPMIKLWDGSDTHVASGNKIPWLREANNTFPIEVDGIKLNVNIYWYGEEEASVVRGNNVGCSFGSQVVSPKVYSFTKSNLKGIKAEKDNMLAMVQMPSYVSVKATIKGTDPLLFSFEVPEIVIGKDRGRFIEALGEPTSVRVLVNGKVFDLIATKKTEHDPTQSAFSESQTEGHINLQVPLINLPQWGNSQAEECTLRLSLVPLFGIQRWKYSLLEQSTFGFMEKTRAKLQHLMEEKFPADPSHESSDDESFAGLPVSLLRDNTTREVLTNNEDASLCLFEVRIKGVSDLIWCPFDGNEFKLPVNISQYCKQIQDVTFNRDQLKDFLPVDDLITFIKNTIKDVCDSDDPSERDRIMTDVLKFGQRWVDHEGKAATIDLLKKASFLHEFVQQDADYSNKLARIYVRQSSRSNKGRNEQTTEGPFDAPPMSPARKTKRTRSRNSENSNRVVRRRPESLEEVEDDEVWKQTILDERQRLLKLLIESHDVKKYWPAYNSLDMIYIKMTKRWERLQEWVREKHGN
tara:strand:+ start:268 stop:2565 length:2298 start_codon:yes stop_codon:yes gene_type:complete